MAEILIKKIIKKEEMIEKIICKKCELLIYSFFSGEDTRGTCLVLLLRQVPSLDEWTHPQGKPGKDGETAAAILPLIEAL